MSETAQSPTQDNGSGNVAKESFSLLRQLAGQAPQMLIGALIVLGSIYLLRDPLMKLPEKNAEALKEAIEPCIEAEKHATAVAERSAEVIGKNTVMFERLDETLRRFERRDRDRK